MGCPLINHQFRGTPICGNLQICCLSLQSLEIWDFGFETTLVIWRFGIPRPSAISFTVTWKLHFLHIEKHEKQHGYRPIIASAYATGRLWSWVWFFLPDVDHPSWCRHRKREVRGSNPVNCVWLAVVPLVLVDLYISFRSEINKQINLDQLVNQMNKWIDKKHHKAINKYISK